MLEAFKQYSTQHFPFLYTNRLLVTVSGGLDSMVLLWLCHSLGLDITVAHCNFGLRAAESDQDAHFVETYCTNYSIPYYGKNFNTATYAVENKLSTQLAARELRYNWFYELSESEGFDYILTAHHSNDDVETFLINLGRGTGIHGLDGIPQINDKIVRPLLTFSRKQIREFANKVHLTWREDSSNKSDTYVRNHLRHHAIPALEAATPQFLKGFEQTKNNLQQASQLLSVYTEQLKAQFLNFENDLIRINLDSIQQHAVPKALLYALLSSYNFTAWDDVYDLMSSQPGKQVLSSTHKLIKDRSNFLVTPLNHTDTQIIYWDKNIDSICGPFGRLTKEEVEVVGDFSNEVLYIDGGLLEFPLAIRTRRDGDTFYPFGLRGKKKLNKYFKDEKLSLIAKDKTWLLCSSSEIIWVIGRRADDRFKITSSTQTILKITLHEK